MSVRIRLTRAGRKKVPHFRIVVIDSHNRRDGAYIDQIGTYHPRFQPSQLNIDEKKALEWLMVGAKPSDTVHSLLSGQGILLQYDLLKKNIAPDVIADAVSKWRSVKAERDARHAQSHKTKRKAKAPAGENPAETS